MCTWSAASAGASLWKKHPAEGGGRLRHSEKNTDPAKGIDNDLPLAIFHDWVDEGCMQVCPRTNGYRIRQDMDPGDVDPDFTLNTIA